MQTFPVSSNLVISNQYYENTQVSSCREEAVQLSMLLALATVREPVIWHTSSNGTPIISTPTSLPPANLPPNILGRWGSYPLMLLQPYPATCSRLMTSAGHRSNKPLATDALCDATFLLHEALQADCKSLRRGAVYASKSSDRLTRQSGSLSSNMKVDATQMMPITRCTTSVLGATMS